MRYVNTVVIVFVFTVHVPVSRGDAFFYRISGTLDEGGIFEGTFTVDTNSVDLLPSYSHRGMFSLLDLSLTLTNTTLFMSGGNTSTSGFANSGDLYQTSGGLPVQSLLFDFHSDEGNAGVFTDVQFGPFVGDPNLAAPITADFVGGYFDGAGQSDVASISLVQVPEPAAWVLLACCFAMCTLQRVKRSAIRFLSSNQN